MFCPQIFGRFSIFAFGAGRSVYAEFRRQDRSLYAGSTVGQAVHTKSARESAQEGLIRFGKTFRIANTIMLPLWRVKSSAKISFVAFLLNSFLMVSCLPVLCAGVILFCCTRSDWFQLMNFKYLAGFYLGMLPTAILLEAAHVLAGLSYGAHVFEVGIFWHLFPGAYILMDSQNVLDCFRRIQINAAGVEMHALLVSLGLILDTIILATNGLFFGFVSINNFRSVEFNTVSGF